MEGGRAETPAHQVGCLRLATSTLPAGEGAATLRWATFSRSWSLFFWCQRARAPHAYSAAPVSQGPQEAVRVVPLRGVQGNRQIAGTYCSLVRPGPRAESLGL